MDSKARASRRRLQLSAGRVFSDRARDDDLPMRYTESSAAFFDRVAGPFWDQIRDLTEDWVARFPDAARPDIVGRLTSADDRQSSAAFWELYLYHVFVALGHDVLVHPNVPAGPRPPDLRVAGESGEFYVEAKALFGTGDARGASARANEVYEAVNKIHSPNFFVAVSLDQIGPLPLATKGLRRQLESWLAGLNPDVVQFETRLSGGESFTWTRDGWVIEFRPIPVKKSRRGAPDHRPLGVLDGGGASFIDDAGDLRSALKKKGSAYGTLDLPLVVAINVATAFHDDHDTINALYGTEQFRFSRTDPDAPAELIRARDGYWGVPWDWKRTHVSGMLYGPNVAPWSVTRSVPRLWHHPGAATSLATPSVWHEARFALDRIDLVDAQRDIHGLLGLPAGWPIGEAFPRET